MAEAAEARTHRLRRIITGHDLAGRSVVALDGPPSPVLEFLPGAGLDEIWTHKTSESDGERGARPGLLPPKAGAKFRWFTVLPQPADIPPPALASFSDGAFAAMEQKEIRPDTSRYPGMHQTDTVDFNVVIEGRVRLILDGEDTVLEPGDVVVQRGTNHAWVCEGDRPALLASVLIENG